MSHNFFDRSLFLLFFITCISFGQTIKVACVGNFVTYGAGIKDRELNSYPKQLQNFGPYFVTIQNGLND